MFGDGILENNNMDAERIDKAAREEYNSWYSTGAFCHEQSFLWGYQEGVYFAEKYIREMLEKAAQESTSGISVQSFVADFLNRV